MKEASIKDQADNAMAQGIAEAQAKTAAANKKADELTVTNLKQKADYENRLAIHVAAALARTERLSIATGTPACSVLVAAAGANPGTASEPAGEARSEVLPGVASRILSIAGDSAGTVRDYNTIIDLYNVARETCNKP